MMPVTFMSATITTASEKLVKGKAMLPSIDHRKQSMIPTIGFSE